MFTGIVDSIGRVEEVTQSPQGISLRLASPYCDLTLGESIAVDGACLTVTRIEGSVFDCDLSPETLDKTRAASYRVGTRVHLERALRMGDRLGGHVVTGHVDQTCTLAGARPVGDYVELRFSGLAKEATSLLVEKGCVAVLGTSLTVNEVTEDGFSVMLIPHTLEKTTLSELKTGDRVNIEFDWMTKILVKEIRGHLERQGRPSAKGV